jgi:hypothetical protein
MDMRYHWLTDRVGQTQFHVYWRPGRENLGDYHTKHHSAQHHKDMHRFILYQANSLQDLRWCVKLPPLPQPQLRAHGDTDKYKRPESHPTKECARACMMSQERTKLLLLSHNFSNVMINSTSINEVHYRFALNSWTYMVREDRYDVFHGGILHLDVLGGPECLCALLMRKRFWTGVPKKCECCLRAIALGSTVLVMTNELHLD